MCAPGTLPGTALPQDESRRPKPTSSIPAGMPTWICELSWFDTRGSEPCRDRGACARRAFLDFSDSVCRTSSAMLCTLRGKPDLDIALRESPPRPSRCDDDGTD